MRRTRVLFMPYQAAMWDSLESIWAAAAHDPSCEVIVMASPYHSVGADGRIRTTDEGPLLPPEITPTGWDPRVLATWPDIVYLHNPYDAENAVTRTFAEAHTAALRKAGRIVVYVPYYLSGALLAPPHRFLSSYANVDCIVAQSEHLAAQYDASIRPRILSLGSPKVDRAVTRRLDPQTTPWGETVNRKRVILVNSSISCLLNEGARALDNVVRVVEAAEQTPDFVVLWRPHPLLAGTINSMRPDLDAAYRAVLDRVAASESALLDDTIDFGPAMTRSDCYVGDDSSSLVPLFGATGRPILVFGRRPITLAADGGPRPVLAQILSVDEREYWAVDRQVGGLFRLDIETGACDLLAGLGPQSPGYQSRTLLRVGRLVVVASSLNDDVATYDPSSGDVSRIPVGGGEEIPFCDAIAWGDHLVLVPAQHDDVVLVEPRSGDVITWSGWAAGTRHALGSATTPHAYPRSAILAGDVLVLASARGFSLVLADLARRTTYEIRVADAAGGFALLVAVDGYLVTSVFGSNTLASVRMSDLEVRVSSAAEHSLASAPASYSALIARDGRVLCLPEGDGTVLWFDPRSGVFEPFSATAASPGLASLTLSGGAVGATCCPDGSLFFQDGRGGHLVQIAPNGSVTTTARTMAFSTAPPRADMAENFGADGSGSVWVARENAWDVSVADFLAYVRTGCHDETAQRRRFERIIGPTDGRVGERIHAAIRAEAAAARG